MALLRASARVGLLGLLATVALSVFYLVPPRAHAAVWSVPRTSGLGRPTAVAVDVGSHHRGPSLFFATDAPGLWQIEPTGRRVHLLGADALGANNPITSIAVSPSGDLFFVQPGPRILREFVTRTRTLSTLVSPGVTVVIDNLHNIPGLSGGVLEPTSVAVTRAGELLVGGRFLRNNTNNPIPFAGRLQVQPRGDVSFDPLVGESAIGTDLGFGPSSQSIKSAPSQPGKSTVIYPHSDVYVAGNDINHFFVSAQSPSGNHLGGHDGEIARVTGGTRDSAQVRLL